MNGFDVFLLVLGCLLVLVGVIKGIVRILIGVAALVAAFALAAYYHQPLASRMGVLDVSDGVLRLIAYALIFIGVMLTGGLITYLVSKLIKASMLNWVDRTAGAAAGLIAATLLAALLVLPVVAYSPWGPKALGDSMLAPYILGVAEAAATVAPPEMADRYREGVEDLRKIWDAAPIDPSQQPV
jgi:membrane protein required for colicin V production